MTRIKVDPETVWIESVSIDRIEDDQKDLLRGLHADVMVRDVDSGELTCVGTVSGRIAFESTEVLLATSADAISADALNLAHAADEIRRNLDNYAEATPDAVVLIDSIRIQEQWRGSRIAGPIITQVLQVLHLDPKATWVVLEPEPQIEAGRPMPRGPQRTAALARLRETYADAGFSKWRRGPVWWRLVPAA
jgi:hypothetical protein